MARKYNKPLEYIQVPREVKALLKTTCNVDATLINPRFITGLDAEMLNDLKANHLVVVTLEDSELDGGFGEKIAHFYGSSDVKVLSYGSFKEFTDKVCRDALYTKYRLTPQLIVEDIKAAL